MADSLLDFRRRIQDTTTTLNQLKQGIGWPSFTNGDLQSDEALSWLENTMPGIPNGLNPLGGVGQGLENYVSFFSSARDFFDGNADNLFTSEEVATASQVVFETSNNLPKWGVTNIIDAITVCLGGPWYNPFAWDWAKIAENFSNFDKHVEQAWERQQARYNFTALQDAGLSVEKAVMLTQVRFRDGETQYLGGPLYQSVEESLEYMNYNIDHGIQHDPSSDPELLESQDATSIITSLAIAHVTGAASTAATITAAGAMAFAPFRPAAGSTAGWRSTSVARYGLGAARFGGFALSSAFAIRNGVRSVQNFQECRIGSGVLLAGQAIVGGVGGAMVTSGYLVVPGAILIVTAEGGGFIINDVLKLTDTNGTHGLEAQSRLFETERHNPLLHGRLTNYEVYQAFTSDDPNNLTLQMISHYYGNDPKILEGIREDILYKMDASRPVNYLDHAFDVFDTFDTFDTFDYYHLPSDLIDTLYAQNVSVAANLDGGAYTQYLREEFSFINGANIDWMPASYRTTDVISDIEDQKHGYLYYLLTEEYGFTSSDINRLRDAANDQANNLLELVQNGRALTDLEQNFRITPGFIDSLSDNVNKNALRELLDPQTQVGTFAMPNGAEVDAYMQRYDALGESIIREYELYYGNCEHQEGLENALANFDDFRSIFSGSLLTSEALDEGFEYVDQLNVSGLSKDLWRTILLTEFALQTIESAQERLNNGERLEDVKNWLNETYPADLPADVILDLGNFPLAIPSEFVRLYDNYRSLYQDLIQEEFISTDPLSIMTIEEAADSVRAKAIATLEALTQAPISAPPALLSQNNGVLAIDGALYASAANAAADAQNATVVASLAAFAERASGDASAIESIRAQLEALGLQGIHLSPLRVYVENYELLDSGGLQTNVQAWSASIITAVMATKGITAEEAAQAIINVFTPAGQAEQLSSLSTFSGLPPQVLQSAVANAQAAVAGVAVADASLPTFNQVASFVVTDATIGGGFAPSTMAGSAYTGILAASAIA